MAASGRAPKQLHSIQAGDAAGGRLISIPVVVADHEGDRYVVAMLGEGTNWVANVRAAGGNAVLRHRRHEHVRLEEIDPKRRGRILRRYLQLSPERAPTCRWIPKLPWMSSTQLLPSTPSS